MKNITLLKLFEVLSSKINCWIPPKNAISTLRFFKSNERNPIDYISKFSDLLLTKTFFILKNQFRVRSAAVFMIFAFALFMPSQMQAQHPYGFMDGNVYSNGTIDWQNVYNKSGLPAGSISTGIIFDGKAPDSIYTGGGTKDHLPINGANASKSWQWKTADASSSDKTNLQEAGAILIAGKIYFFGNKFAAEGTTTIGFWFFKDFIGPIAGGRFEGEHSIGDILVVADIEQGGAVGVIDAYRWVGDGNGTLPSSSKSMIKIGTDGTTLAAIVNTNQEPTPWSHQSKGVGADLMPPVTFFEGFIDVAALDGSSCFSSFLVETRSSNPVTSILEDFTSGAFNVQPTLNEIADITKCQGDALGILTAVANGGIPPLTYTWTVPAGANNPGNVASFSPTVSGTYSVIVTGQGIGGEGTCPSEPESAVVTINLTPVVDDLTDVTICSDTGGYDLPTITGTNLTGNEAYWTGSGGTGTKYVAGDNLNSTITLYIYDETGTDPNCYDEEMFTLTVNPNPVCDITGEQVICTGSSSTFTAAAGMKSYSWTGPGGFTATTQSITVGIAGTYVVTITNSNDCSSTCNRALTVENCAHIFPTQTDCDEYKCITQSETPIDYTLSNVCLTVQGNKVKNAVPGVFFYYADVVGKANSTTVVVDQTTELSKYFIAQNEQNVRVFSSSCGAIVPTSVTIYDNSPQAGVNKGDVIITFPSTLGADYIISVKYDVKTIIGANKPAAGAASNFVMLYNTHGGTTIGGSGAQISLNSNGNCDPNPIQNPDSCSSIITIAPLVDATPTAKVAPIDAVGFDAYPVPFKDQLTIKYKFDYKSDVKIEVFNAQGMSVLSKTDTNSYLDKEVTLDLKASKRQEQVYVVKVTTNQGTFTKKVMSSK